MDTTNTIKLDVAVQLLHDATKMEKDAKNIRDNAINMIKNILKTGDKYDHPLGTIDYIKEGKPTNKIDLDKFKLLLVIEGRMSSTVVKSLEEKSMVVGEKGRAAYIKYTPSSKK